MTHRYAYPGALIIDNSFSPPTAEQLAAGARLGVVANMRYTSEPVTRNKNLTRAQAEAGWRVGVGALANQEQTHEDSLEGYAGGLRRARSFLAVAEHIGYPKTVPAIVSVDTSWHANALDFVRAFDFSMRSWGWEQIGTYFFGPGPAEQLTNAGVGADVLWQAHAGSYWVSRVGADQTASKLNATVRKCPNRSGWEVISNYSHLFQEYGYVRLADGPFAPGQIDENHVRRPVRVWFPATIPGQSGGGGFPPPDPNPNPGPVPIPLEDDMPICIASATAPDPKPLYELIAGQKRHIPGAEGPAWAKVAITYVDDATLAAIPDYASEQDWAGVVATTVRDAQGIITDRINSAGLSTLNGVTQALAGLKIPAPVIPPITVDTAAIAKAVNDDAAQRMRG